MSSIVYKVRRYKTNEILVLSTSCLESIVILRLEGILLSAMDIRIAFVGNRKIKLKSGWMRHVPSHMARQ